MSCVIGLVTELGVLFGADSAANDGNILIPNRYAKIEKREVQIWSCGDTTVDFLIGTCGSPQVGSVIRNYLKIPRIINPSEMDRFIEYEFVHELRVAMENADHEKGDDEFLIGVDGKLYFIDTNLGIVRTMRGYDAIGSAREVALGAMYAAEPFAENPRRHIDIGLSACSDLTIHVCPPYEYGEAHRIRYD